MGLTFNHTSKQGGFKAPGAKNTKRSTAGVVLLEQLNKGCARKSCDTARKLVDIGSILDFNEILRVTFQSLIQTIV